MTAAAPARVLTLGEAMVLLDPTTDGEIRSGMQFSLRVAGAEANFAIALRRLGISATWVSRLGKDPFGDVVLETLAAEDVDLSLVGREDSPTGLFFKWRSAGRSKLIYYRKASAASFLKPSDIPDGALDRTHNVHLTGITMALSRSARETVIDVARRAHARRIPVTFDPNYRPALWSGPDEAAAAHRPVLDIAEWYFCGLEEGCALWEATDAGSLFAALDAAGVRRAVVRIGPEGALVNDAGTVTHVAPDRLEEVLDEVGAGDAFSAGFVYGLINGWSPPDCARAGNVIAAHALLGTGDWETLPYISDVQDAIQPRTREGT
jgi:2-dehydro-3-deoxygluconokinase